MPESYVRGNTIKYLRVPNEVNELSFCDPKCFNNETCCLSACCSLNDTGFCLCHWCRSLTRCKTTSSFDKVCVLSLLAKPFQRPGLLMWHAYFFASVPFSYVLTSNIDKRPSTLLLTEKRPAGNTGGRGRGRGKTVGKEGGGRGGGRGTSLSTVTTST
jgi:uncharacterized membrane protein YgcG